MRRALLGGLLAGTVLLSLACEDERAGLSAATPVASPTPRLSISIPATPLASLADAKARLETPLLVPKTLPPGYQLARIIHDFSDDRSVPTINAVRLYYRTAAGDELVIRQGHPMPHIEDGPYLVAPADQKGRLTVRGQPATWVSGVARQAAPGARQLVWEPGPLELRWQTEGFAGVSLTSNTLTLAELLVIAEALTPY
jgi:hypothetical protein